MSLNEGVGAGARPAPVLPVTALTIRRGSVRPGRMSGMPASSMPVAKQPGWPTWRGLRWEACSGNRLRNIDMRSGAPCSMP